MGCCFSREETAQTYLFSDMSDPASNPPPPASASDGRSSDELRQSTRRIAHDFNNTLGTILGNLELLRMDLEPGHPATESVIEIKKATDKARALVHELFTLTGPAPAPGSVEIPPLPATTPAPDSPPTASMGTELPRGNGQHILYIDDEEPLVFLASNLFKRLGYRVSGFTDAQTACDAFLSNPAQYDLVVTDHNLKTTTGIEIATRMLAAHPRTPIVLATGELTEELSEAAKDIGIRHVIYKPNTVDALCQAIHQLATRR